MRVRIKQGAYGKGKTSHHLELIGISDELHQLGYRMTRMEKGQRNSLIPVKDVNLEAGPDDGVEIDIPITLRLEPYDHQAALNVSVALLGLRERLNEMYRLRDGSELAVRLFVPNFEGEYLAPEEADEDRRPEAPSDRPRERLMRAIAVRRGAVSFRSSQLERFDENCAISGCTQVDVLEAAHIRAYRRDADNAPRNGILLRADLHTLFDLDLIAVDLDGHRASVHRSVLESQYRQYHGQPIAVPNDGFDADALQTRWIAYRAKGE
jgi:hypothetical protein